MALFVPLDASYDQDPKVLDLDDERAELLFIRSLAYSKRHLTDGLVHRRALRQIAPCVADVEPEELAADLVRVGLWVEVGRGWRIVAWLKRNPGSEEILTPSTARELAHRRHHVKTGRPKEGCPYCFPAVGNVQVNAHDAVPHCGADAVPALPEPEPEPEPEPSPVSTSVTTSSVATRTAEPAAPAQAEPEQAIRRTAALIGRATATGAANPAAYAASVTRRILEDADPTDRDRIRQALTDGATPEAITATWTTPEPPPANVHPLRTPRPRCTNPDCANGMTLDDAGHAHRCTECNPDPLAVPEPIEVTW